MKGNVFQCHGENADKQQFMKTVGILEEHINKTVTYPQDVTSVCKSFKIVVLSQPENLTKTEYETDMSKKMIWETLMKNYMKRVDLLESNTRAIYAIVWGQCSPMMQSKLESLDDFEARSEECDCIWLQKEIQGITHRFEGTRNVFISLDDAWCGYYNCQQGHHQSLHDYLKDFQGLVQVLEHYGAALGANGPYQDSLKAMVMKDAPAGLTTEAYHVKAVAAAKKKSMAISFLKRADRKRYGNLWIELENNFTRSLDHYPSDLTGAYGLLLNNKAPLTQVHSKRRDDSPEETEVSRVSFFLQNGAPIPGTDGVTHGRVNCYNCQAQGHYAGNCPTPSAEGVHMLQLENVPNPPAARSAAGYPTYRSEFTFLHIAGTEDEDFNFHQGDSRYSIIPDTCWILLDSQSTVSVFKNPRLLTNIKASNTTLRVHTNRGTQLSSQIGTVRNFGEVWFNEKSLANILSMAAVRKLCRITMDTSVEAAMHVHRKEGSIMTFKEYKSGLYYYDTGNSDSNLNRTTEHAYLFLNTVASNKAAYTQRKIEGADKARALYRKLGHPSEAVFQKISQNNFIRNCPVTSDNAKRALIIYGPDIATLKGKTTKHQNRGIPNYQPIQIPAPIISKYNTIRLFMDIFGVNGNPFFHTISQWIKFRTIAPINNRSKKTLLMEAKAVINMYETCGFNISRIEADREFSCLTKPFCPYH
jgi:hypothetical protein